MTTTYKQTLIDQCRLIFSLYQQKAILSNDIDMMKLSNYQDSYIQAKMDQLKRIDMKIDQMEQS